MFGLLTAALNGLLAFVFRTVVVKFVLFFGLMFIVHEFIPVMVSWMSLNYDIPSLFQLLPDSMWFYFNLVNFAQGLMMILNAWLVKFMIRRIPFIG
ncbi:DUF2523 domain-containing protein [Salmonella enterica]|nr:DUF2523 domain-containing protein [Salmonella enterica subsp. enterica serovar Irumu]EBU3703947.1 DUF2523 domain-containing protein [Salmonella enterica]ECD0158332.1 DUF2523 domain-containing protein [Salmonella enterica subsp. enterica]ECX3450955.1 DUF2523 domain-containing protein [Salmonella enterica subsp. enterica serovar Rubislaw]ECH7918650.1 DUF2523 domain-containing protein [Salmonella enterica subsp. enterica]